MGSILKNRPSQHNYKSPKQFLLITHLKASGLNGSKRTKFKRALPFNPVSEDESQMGQPKNRPSEKLHKTNRIKIFATNCF